MIAASLKRGDVPECDQSCVYFRDQMIAASLKLFRR